MDAATFIANPAGDANVEIAREVMLELVFRTGKTMHHDRTEAIATAAANDIVEARDEVGMCIALGTQEQRLAAIERDRELALERRRPALGTGGG